MAVITFLTAANNCDYPVYRCQLTAVITALAAVNNRGLAEIDIYLSVSFVRLSVRQNF